MRLLVFVFPALLLFASWQTAPAQIGSKPQSSQKDSLAEKAPRWVRMEVPLHVSHDESIGWASAEGFWQSTSTSRDQQLAYPIAVKITCNRDEKICREAEAAVMTVILPGGSLQADMGEFTVSSWTRNGIVADNTDPNPCGNASRLTIDFKSNSFIVTDYPTKANVPKFCIAKDADSYALHGGSWVVMPTPTWNPLVENEK